LWWVSGSDELSPTAKDVLETRTNEIFFSTISSFELAVLVSTQRKPPTTLKADEIEAFISEQLRINEFHLLRLDLNHSCRVGLLPFHHRDPWDRILVAQAQIENLVMLTHDEKIRAYDVQTLW
jgi:PIN domain nuclease of toxin-antitoxin system